MKPTTVHYIQLVLTILTGGAETLAHYSASGNQLPLHLTAAGLLAMVSFLGLVSRSILPTPEVKP
jgi:DNA-binding IclR family transcriptional regulator